MLGIVLIYFLGKYYHDLALSYKKNKWGFAILGVASYYIGSFLGGILLVLLVEFLDPGKIEDFNDTALGIFAIPFGLFASWALYKYLEKRFINELKPNESNFNSDVLDDDFLA